MTKSPLHQRTKRPEDPGRHGWRFGLFIVESHLVLYKQKLTKSNFPRFLRFAALDLGSAMPSELKSIYFLGCPLIQGEQASSLGHKVLFWAEPGRLKPVPA
jgi:hypothetical protein